MEEEIKDLLFTHLGDLKLTATSDVHEGKVWDTKIQVSGGQLCWVSGELRQEFIKKIQDLVNEYRI